MGPPHHTSFQIPLFVDVESQLVEFSHRRISVMVGFKKRGFLIRKEYGKGGDWW
jgi:hypothetical protein